MQPTCLRKLQLCISILLKQNDAAQTLHLTKVLKTIKIFAQLHHVLKKLFLLKMLNKSSYQDASPSFIARCIQHVLPPVLSGIISTVHCLRKDPCQSDIVSLWFLLLFELYKISENLSDSHQFQSQCKFFPQFSLITRMPPFHQSHLHICHPVRLQ